MLSKLICHASTREESIARMRRALMEYRVEGIQTTIPFFTWLMSHPDFREGRFDTGFIDRILPQMNLEQGGADGDEVEAAITAAAILTFEEAQQVRLPEETDSPWKWAGRRDGMRGRR